MLDKVASVVWSKAAKCHLAVVTLSSLFYIGNVFLFFFFLLIFETVAKLFVLSFCIITKMYYFYVFVNSKFYVDKVLYYFSNSAENGGDWQ
jgi:hypothetical protein